MENDKPKDQTKKTLFAIWLLGFICLIIYSIWWKPQPTSCSDCTEPYIPLLAIWFVVGMIGIGIEQTINRIKR